MALLPQATEATRSPEEPEVKATASGLRVCRQRDAVKAYEQETELIAFPMGPRPAVPRLLARAEERGGSAGPPRGAEEALQPQVRDAPPGIRKRDAVSHPRERIDPVMEQYHRIKAQHQRWILLYCIGEFYETSTMTPSWSAACWASPSRRAEGARASPCRWPAFPITP